MNNNETVLSANSLSSDVCSTKCVNGNVGYDFGIRGTASWCECCENNCGGLNEACQNQVNTDSQTISNYDLLCTYINTDSGDLYLGMEIGDKCNWKDYKTVCVPGDTEENEAKEWVTRCNENGLVSESYVQKNPNCLNEKNWLESIENPLLSSSVEKKDEEVVQNIFNVEFKNLDISELNSEERQKVNLSYCINTSENTSCFQIPNYQILGNNSVDKRISVSSIKQDNFKFSWILNYPSSSVNCETVDSAEAVNKTAGYISKVYNSTPTDQSFSIPNVKCSPINTTPADSNEGLDMNVLVLIYDGLPDYALSIGYRDDPFLLVEDTVNLLEEASISSNSPTKGKNLNVNIIDIIESKRLLSQKGTNCDQYLQQVLSGNWTESDWSSTDCWGSGTASYQNLVGENPAICSRINSGEIDEVWVFTFGYGGLWETTLVTNDDTAYPSFSGGVSEVRSSCNKDFFIHGLNFDVPPDQALHSFAHRMENVLEDLTPKEYAEFDTLSSRYEVDSSINIGLPDQEVIGCGNVHFPPNAEQHYDYENLKYVETDCKDWNPLHSGLKTKLNCKAWNCTHEGYLKWWFGHMPGKDSKLIDLSGDKISNWWDLYVNYVDISNKNIKSPTKTEDIKEIIIPLPPEESLNDKSSTESIQYDYNIKLSELKISPSSWKNLDKLNFNSIYENAIREAFTAKSNGGKWVSDVLTEMGETDIRNYLDNLNIYSGDEVDKLLESRNCSLGTTPMTVKNEKIQVDGVAFSGAGKDSLVVLALVVEEIVQARQYENIAVELFNEGYFNNTRFSLPENFITTLNDGIPPSDSNQY
ncbi:hypothetical protein KC717_06850, partial [Candidatus Dojkabacteria bacterium]|nr:hypothetical protein [Candidatus Dojkabacteria bacterium]